jgi:hypothetical protein
LVEAEDGAGIARWWRRRGAIVAMPPKTAFQLDMNNLTGYKTQSSQCADPFAGGSSAY